MNHKMFQIKTRNYKNRCLLFLLSFLYMLVI
jgi:hypothetical protein